MDRAPKKQKKTLSRVWKNDGVKDSKLGTSSNLLSALENLDGMYNPSHSPEPSESDLCLSSLLRYPTQAAEGSSGLLAHEKPSVGSGEVSGVYSNVNKDVEGKRDKSPTVIDLDSLYKMSSPSPSPPSLDLSLVDLNESTGEGSSGLRADEKPSARPEGASEATTTVSEDGSVPYKSVHFQPWD